VIVDLIGKAAHIRTVPVPDWVRAAVDVWLNSAGITQGRMFRCVSIKGSVWGESITEKMIWHVVKEYAGQAGIAKLSPHDCRRYAESGTMPNAEGRHVAARLAAKNRSAYSGSAGILFGCEHLLIPAFCSGFVWGRWLRILMLI
jgi:integrase